MPIKMFLHRDAERHAAQLGWDWATDAQRAEMLAYAEREAHEGPIGAEIFHIGVNSCFNIIDWRSGVQVYLGADYLGGGVKFWVGIPAHARNSGVRAFDSAKTLAEALEIADGALDAARLKMDRAHARALKMNAAV